jgi:hypothetical protein
MISYLGFPISLPDGSLFGTICVLDKKRNEYSEWIEKLMRQFLSLIESHIELIFMNKQLGDDYKGLSDYVTELQALRGLVPICASCKSIHNDQDQWHPVEHYLSKNPEVDFSHEICPDCAKKLYPDFVD